MIVVENYSGIGNILKNLVSALRRADIDNDTVCLHTTNAANHIFSFEQNKKEPKNFIENSCSWQLELHKNDLNNPILKENKNIVVMDNPKDYWVHSNVIDMQYHNIDNKLVQSFIPYFKRIIFNQKILETVKIYCDTNNIENCIGVHLRSWSDHEGRKTLLHDTNMFISAMERFPNDVFFVSTDDDKILEQVKEIFGDRIISRQFKEEKNTYYNFNFDAAENSMIDMLVTSKCKQLIGTYQSTFSECIWWLSDCKPITIPKPKAIVDLENTLHLN